MSDAWVWLAALASAVTVGMASYLLLRPRRALAPLVTPYVQVARRRLGHLPGAGELSGLAVDARSEDRAISGATAVLGPVLGPPVVALLALASRGSGGVENDRLARRLRQAGMDLSVEQFRLRQAGTAFGALVAATSLTVLSRAGGAAVLAAAVCGAVGGAMWWRGRLDSAWQRRTDTIRLELPTVALLLAVRVRVGLGPLESIRTLCDQATGQVATELQGALAAMTAGMGEESAMELAAEETPAPQAARLYRLLSSGLQGGGNDLADTLRSLADELRSERREEVERSSIRRRTAMVVPTLLLLAPPLVLFLAAPLPSIVLGR